MKPSARAVSISPLARASSPSPAAAGTSANSAGWPTATPNPSSATQRQQRRQRVDAERDPGHDGRLRERDADEQRAVLEAVDDRAGEPGAEHDRTPQREEQRRDRERRAGALLHVQDEREHGQEVAERGEAGGAGEQAEVAGGIMAAIVRGRPFAHRSACVNVARRLAPASQRTTVGAVLEVRLAGGLRLESDGVELAAAGVAAGARRARLPGAAPRPARRAPSSPRASGPTCSTSRRARACAPR